MKWLLSALILMIPPSTASADEGEYLKYPAPNLVSTLPLEAGTRFQYTGSGADRCEVDDCLCQVRPDPFNPREKIASSNRRVSLFFEEGSAQVNQGQKSELTSFLKKEPASSYTVVGYTDECGTHEYNKELVQDRVKNVSSLMTPSSAASVDDVVFNAEAGSGHDPAVRRVDVIAHTKSRLTTMIDKVQADVYLIDASGSMWEGWKSWVDIVAVSFKPGSKIYLSKMTGCNDGQLMGDVTPYGGTEIWYSYWRVLDFMKPGQTLAVISDFRSEVPLTRRESALIQQKVIQKNIKVIAIAP